MKTNEPNKQTNGQIKAILSGGGTGGHLYPALAIADQMVKDKHISSLLFVGAQGKMEMGKVPQSGYSIKGLWISGYQRGKLISNLLLPFKILFSLLKSWSILKKFKPQIALGTGGYASAPLLYLAAKIGLPTIIQEQNFYPGLTNRFLGKYVDKICVVYQNMEQHFPPHKMVVTGNPVRSTIFENEHSVEQAKKQFKLDPYQPTILIIGGSLGARTINEAILANHEQLGNEGYQLIWQTGKIYYKEMMERMGDGSRDRIQVQAFIDNMPLAYKAADLIISRAGAITLAELALLKKPAILAPSPNVADDHQKKNAQAMVNENAASMIEDQALKDELADEAIKILQNQAWQQQLAENIGRFAKPNAAQVIVDEAFNLIQEREMAA